MSPLAWVQRELLVPEKQAFPEYNLFRKLLSDNNYSIYSWKQVSWKAFH